MVASLLAAPVLRSPAVLPGLLRMLRGLRAVQRRAARASIKRITKVPQRYHGPLAVYILLMPHVALPSQVINFAGVNVASSAVRYNVAWDHYFWAACTSA